MQRLLLGLALFTLAAQGGEVEDALKEAFKDDIEGEQVEAIEAAVGVADPEVIRLVAKGLRSKSTAVMAAAIDALGRTRHKKALQQLHSLYRRDRDLGENEDLFALLLKSIGRHGDASSIKILVDNPFRHLTTASGTARIMGLSNIRDKNSVEELIKATRKGGGSKRGRQSQWRNVFREQFRVAMMVLTGVDQGTDRESWQAWWRKNKDKFKMAAERPIVPTDVSDYWEQYWQKAYNKGGKPKPPRLAPPFERVAYPSPAQVNAAEEQLKSAYKDGNEALIVSTIEATAGIMDDRIVRLIARGMRMKNKHIRLEAITMLGWMKHPEGLKQLHRMYRRNKDLSKQEQVFAELLKAIGRHGSASSIEVLKSDPFKNLTLWSGRARIYGLANVRETRSVVTLMKGLRLTGTSRRRGSTDPGARFMDAFRVALAVLTGTDQGESKEAWEKWWKENKRSFRVQAERPKVPDQVRLKWEAYWREPY